MFKRKLLGLGWAMSVIGQAYACNGYFPENELRVGVYDKKANSMTQVKFNQIIDRVGNLYRPVIKKRGGILRLVRKWQSSEVNAYANQQGQNYVVMLHGGMARHQKMTMDGYTMVVCHEVGHHIGGAPKNTDYGNTWSSIEGQSDYWGAMKCFRRVFENDDNRSIMDSRGVHALVKKKCSAQYSNDNEQALCERIAMTAKDLGEMSMAMSRGRDRGRIDYNTPDQAQVMRTVERHPRAQCRLDTIFQAGLCDRSYQLNVSSRDPNTGVCNRKERFSLGVRPLCWFRPYKAQLVDPAPRRQWPFEEDLVVF
jgi:hypothetical protein